MLLFTPGPTPIPESIRQAMATPTLHHRTKEFESIFAKARLGLKAMIGLPEVLMLASSGTGAMEASVTQLCASKLLSVSCGKFGERWGKIAKANAIPYIELVSEWDTPIQPQAVLEAVKNDSSIDAIALQVCESAGGLRLDVESIAKMIKAHNKDIIIIADAITALGIEAIDTTHIDALIGGSQKAFMLPPGMSIIGLSSLALNKLESISRSSIASKSWNGGLYFSFLQELKNQQKNTTAWTAPTTLIIGLVRYFEMIQAFGLASQDSNTQQSLSQKTPSQEALFAAFSAQTNVELCQNALQKGLCAAYAHTKSLALATRAAIQELQLSIYPKVPALAMSAIAHEQSPAIRKAMKALGVNVAAGQDHIKDKIFRINHMGLITAYEASFVINALELSLHSLGIRAFDGKGNAAFLRVLYDVRDVR